MNLDLTSEQLAAQDKARAFSAEYISPAAARNDREEIFPREILNSLAPTGLMTPTLPLEWGGLGLDFIGEALVFEEIGKSCSSVRTILSVHNSLCALTLLDWGTSKQKERFLPALGHGQLLGCFALTEFTAGSYATNQNLIARYEGGSWVPRAHHPSFDLPPTTLAVLRTDPGYGFKESVEVQKKLRGGRGAGEVRREFQCQVGHRGQPPSFFSRKR